MLSLCHRLLQVSNVTLLQNYYTQAYATVRKYSSCFVALCPPESQSDGSTFQFFMAGSPYTKVIQDVHKCGICLTAKTLLDFRFAVQSQAPHGYG